MGAIGVGYATSVVWTLLFLFLLFFTWRNPSFASLNIFKKVRWPTWALIKEFFSESMKNDQGEDVSTREIKNILKTVISEENKRKPLTDDKLSKLLKEKGYPIARRTVAKYREQLDIPVARLRKEI